MGEYIDHIVHISLHYRLIISQLVIQLLYISLSSSRPQHDSSRRTGRQIHDYEYDQNNAQYRRYQKQKPFDYITIHFFLSLFNILRETFSAGIPVLRTKANS